MKKYLLCLLIPILFGCDDEGFNNNNPYIPNYTFTFDLNTNLPSYNELKFPGNASYIPNYGARGVYVFNTGSGYTAFDAACPNQPISDCSTMSDGGNFALCDCDGAQYSFYDGVSQGKKYSMKPYRVEVNGDNLTVFN